MSNYKTIPALIQAITKQADQLENGTLSLTELDAMLDNSRAIYERITILRYQASAEQNAPKQAAPVNANITEQQIIDEISTKKPEPKQEEVTIEEEEEEGFSFSFSAEEDIVKEEEPTQQRSLLDQISEDDKSLSVNDKLAADKQLSVGEKLQKSKIEDLRSVIGINQKFLFMNDLFEGEKSHYDAALDKINSLNNQHEVTQYVEHELAAKFNWDNDSDSVMSFKTLVNRKFA